MGVAVLMLDLGCATLMTGTSDDVRISTRPVGATATVQPGQITLTTPATVELTRRQGPYLVTLKLPGYDPQRAYISARTNPWVFANLLLGGIPGTLVDFYSGAWIRLSPTEIEIELVPVRSISEQ